MRRGVVLMDVILAGVMLGVGLAVMLSLASRTVATSPSLIALPSAEVLSTTCSRSSGLAGATGVRTT